MRLLAIVAPFMLAETAEKPVQILRTGKWYFPDYGEVEITTDDLKQYADNFKNDVRRQKLPVVIEHNHELGSFGWVKDMFVSDDGAALMADPGWTDRGKELYNADAFKYISAELYPDYEDTETRQQYKNVATAISITNFPRMKDMREIAAGERAPRAVECQSLSFAEILQTARSTSVNPQGQPTSPAPQTPPATPPTTPPAPIQASEGVVTLQQFAEMQAGFKALELRLGEATTKIADQERIITIERQTRVMLECGEKIDKAKREGRVTPAQADEYLKKLPAMPDDMREFMFADIAARPATAILLGEIGSGGQPAPGALNNNPGDTREALAARQQLIFNEAKGKNAPVTMREALTLANKELSAGVTR